MSERDSGALPRFLTVPEFARLLGQHEGSVRRGIKEGRIPADKVNGRWYICSALVFRNAVAAPAVGEARDAEQCFER